MKITIDIDKILALIRKFLLSLDEGQVDSPTPQPTPTPTPEPEPVPPPVSIEPLDLNKVVWLHNDVSKWPVTGNLSSVGIGSSSIRLKYDKAGVWPREYVRDKALNANPWIFIQIGEIWYAATWEWFRPGQTSKKKSAVAGDHIKKSPLKNWKPVSGITYGFMVSGLARDSHRNVRERTNIVMTEWR